MQLVQTAFVPTVIPGQEIVWPFLAACVFGAIYNGGGPPVAPAAPRVSRQPRSSPR